MNEIDARHRARTFIAGVRPQMGIPDMQAYAKAAKARIRFEALDAGEAGYTIPTPKGFAITVNSNESNERQRFTICHEIAHIILELPSKHEDLPSWSYAKRDLNEVWCDIFASELLMPYELFLKKIPGDEPSVEVIEALTKEFGASFPATASRYASLVAFPCAYVTMERDFVRYAAPNGALRRKGITIPMKCAIPAGSVALRLRKAQEAATHTDVTTAGLARMNMILHDFPTANILSGNTLDAPKFKDGESLRTYDYVVANPPFSDKTWSTGLTPSKDPYQRFAWGVPPTKQGDYAYLLHIIRSMKGAGKAACILPHGVLFRGNAEAVIREQLVRSGILKGIIGLPANLFYGTGIPACILVLDKENATARKGVFMVDASKAFIKDGNKNRLREQDIHKIVDTFTRQVDTPRYARMVPRTEIADPRNDYNLNLPRYIDSTAPEDLQDIDGHLRGGIPERDLDAPDNALAAYWQVLPGVRAALFESAGRPGYARLKLALSEVKPAIFGHAEFTAFNQTATRLFADWRKATTPHLTGFGKDGHPKALIETIAEALLATFKPALLLDAYDIYQHLMDYWAETMQDDAYLIAADGWVKGAQPREIVQAKDKNNKLVWPEPHDYLKGRRRFKSDLVPATILIAKYFAAERDAIELLDNQLATLEQQLDEMREEHSGEDGLFADVVEGEGDKQKITAKAVKARLKEIGQAPDYADEREALTAYADLLDQQQDAKGKRKAAQDDLDKKIDAKYPKLTEAEIKTLVVDDKWMVRLHAVVQGELDRVSQTLTGRIRELAERYATPLPQITDEVATLAARVEQHLKQMGASWK